MSYEAAKSCQSFHIRLTLYLIFMGGGEGYLQDILTPVYIQLKQNPKMKSCVRID